MNFNNFRDTLQNKMEEITLLIKVKISGKRRYSKPWMTSGIETSTCQNLNLYKKTLLADSTPSDVEKYRTHQKLRGNPRQLIM